MAKYKLKELSLSKLEYGCGAAACEYDGYARYVRITDITDDGQLGTDIVSPNYYEEKHILHDGDILFARTGATVGKAFRYRDSAGKCVYAGFLIRMIPNQKIVMPDYIFYFTKSPRYAAFVASNMKVVAQPNINAQQYGDLVINVPALAEQQESVSKLLKIDSLVSLRKEQLAKLDELVKARFVEMFGDPVHNIKKLPTKPLAELGSLDRGRSKHRPRNDPALLGGPYPLIQTGEVTNAGLYITSYHNTYSELGLRQSKMWKAGTLCITIAANIAQTAILTFDACFPDSVVGFVPYGEVCPIYMHYWFSFFQKILDEQAPQVAQKNINLQILSGLEVMVPGLELQEQFVSFVEQTNKSKLTIQASLDKLEVMKKALMQEYFG